MWEYWVDQTSIVERWSPKRQAEEIRGFIARLNDIGAAGWEMIGFESIPLAGALSGNIKGYAYLTFFKRQKST